MLCQKCHKNAASFFYEESVNGKEKKFFLCEECAREMQIGGGFSAKSAYSPFSLLGYEGGLLGSVFGDGHARPSRRCELCGARFSDIAASGKVGCPHCYKVFEKELRTTVHRIHGAVLHEGRRYTGAATAKAAAKEAPTAKASTEKDTLSALKAQLARAIEAEAFEEAARVRDEIKKAEGRA